MSTPLKLDDLWLDRIKASVEGLEYGGVQITVHDGRIVQIERTERKRFESETQHGTVTNLPRTSAQGR